MSILSGFKAELESVKFQPVEVAITDDTILKLSTSIIIVSVIIIVMNSIFKTLTK